MILNPGDDDEVRALIQENREDVIRYNVVMDSLVMLNTRKGYPAWLFSPLVSFNVPGAEDTS